MSRGAIIGEGRIADFHPDNVLLAARGPVIIDWPDATRGQPLADVARTSLLLRLGGLPPGWPRLCAPLPHWRPTATGKKALDEVK